MAIRSWGRSLLATLGGGVLAGAGQLGLAYGLGIVRLDRTFAAATTNHWPAQLAWVGWLAMLAAVAGALLGGRLARRYGLPAAPHVRVALAGAAALGALVVAPLTMQPARTAEVAAVDPVSAAGATALLGAVLGALAGVAGLTYRPVRWNLAALAGAGWLLAIGSALSSLDPGGPLPAVRLGVPDPAGLAADAARRFAILTMPAVALLAGAATGATARWRGHPTAVVVACGAPGPALLALAYLIAGRGAVGDAYQAAPFWGAVIAAGAGPLGSALAALARWPLVTRPAWAGRAERDPGATDEGPTAEPLRAAPTASTDPQPTVELTPAPSDRPPPTIHTDPEPTIELTSAPPDQPPPTIHTDPEPTVQLTLTPPDPASPTASSDPEPTVELTPAPSADDKPAPGAGSARRRRAKGRNRAAAPIPDRDEEYVDWVSGLSEPDDRDGRPNRDGTEVRRSLRRTDRQQTE